MPLPLYVEAKCFGMSQVGLTQSLYEGYSESKERFAFKKKSIDNRKGNEYAGCSTHLHQHLYIVTFDIEAFVVT
jgi:hypothetical protein